MLGFILYLVAMVAFAAIGALAIIEDEHPWVGAGLLLVALLMAAGFLTFAITGQTEQDCKVLKTQGTESTTYYEEANC